MINTKTPSVFLSSGHKGWILDALARESAKAVNLKPNYQYLPVSRRELIKPSIIASKFFPKLASMNVFMHHSTFLEIYKKVNLKDSWNSVFVTHLESRNSTVMQSLKKLNGSQRIIVQNSEMKSILSGIGIEDSKIVIGYGAVDRSIYFPSLSTLENYNTYVLVVGDCKPRKNPEAIEEIIDSLPEIKFVIHGKNWGEYTSLTSRPRENVELIDFSLNQNPSLMRNAATYLSLAHNEGGPIPLMEALASGTPVVATNTGFSSDLINESNGVLIEKSSDLSETREAILYAMSLKPMVEQLDLLEGKYDWKDFGNLLYSKERMLN